MFSFKKFDIIDENSSLKVCTDSVLLGAWADLHNAKKILDIGAGMGILAIISAQRNQEADIFAVEIDKQNADLATLNAENSPWSNRIKVVNTSIEEFSDSGATNFDAIICNPPFFLNSLKSDNERKNIAKHATNLTINKLLECTSTLLSDDGVANFIIPTKDLSLWESVANQFLLQIIKITKVKNYPNKESHRCLIVFSKKKQACIKDQMSIYLEKGIYTEEYKELCKDFYLGINN